MGDPALSKEQRRLVKTAFGPWVFRHEPSKAPTYDEWAAAWDKLYPPGSDMTGRSFAGEASAKAEEAGFESRPPIPKRQRCADCGKDWADPPSKLCPGCQAYQSHLT